MLPEPPPPPAMTSALPPLVRMAVLLPPRSPQPPPPAPPSASPKESPKAYPPTATDSVSPGVTFSVPAAYPPAPPPAMLPPVPPCPQARTSSEFTPVGTLKSVLSPEKSYSRQPVKPAVGTHAAPPAGAAAVAVGADAQPPALSVTKARAAAPRLSRTRRSSAESRIIKHSIARDELPPRESTGMTARKGKGCTDEAEVTWPAHCPGKRTMASLCSSCRSSVEISNTDALA